jgi:hypothetical protein
LSPRALCSRLSSSGCACARGSAVQRAETRTPSQQRPARSRQVCSMSVSVDRSAAPLMSTERGSSQCVGSARAHAASAQCMEGLRARCGLGGLAAAHRVAEQRGQRRRARCQQLPQEGLPRRVTLLCQLRLAVQHLSVRTARQHGCEQSTAARAFTVHGAGISSAARCLAPSMRPPTALQCLSSVVKACFRRYGVTQQEHHTSSAHVVSKIITSNEVMLRRPRNDTRTLETVQHFQQHHRRQRRAPGPGAPPRGTARKNRCAQPCHSGAEAAPAGRALRPPALPQRCRRRRRRQ